MLTGVRVSAAFHIVNLTTAELYVVLPRTLR